MRSRGGRRGRAPSDAGQLLLLAGIVLVIAFVVTALTMSQVAEIEKQAVEEQDDALVVDFAFIRETVGSTMDDLVSASTTNASFEDSFDVMAKSLRVVAADKGYDLQVRLAGEPEGLALSEWSFTQHGWPQQSDGVVDPPTGTPADADVPYHFRSHDDRVVLEKGYLADPSHIRKWDRVDDGIVWVSPCDLSLPVTGAKDPCLKAAIVYLYIADETTAVEEFVVYAFNA